MRKLNFLEKILMIFLTLVFVVSFLLSTLICLKPVGEDARFFAAGIIMVIINVGVFFWTLKVLRKHYDQHNHKGIRIYYYSIILMPLIFCLEYLRFYNQWLYMVIFIAIAAIDIYLINKEFGRLTIRINDDHDDLLAGDLTTPNGSIKIRGKNKKIKSSTEKIEIGDLVLIERNGHTVATLNVVKPPKKA